MLVSSIPATKEPAHITSVIEVVQAWTENYVRNSYLSAINRALKGQPQWFGSEGFNIFGRECHQRYLQPELPIHQLTPSEEALLEAMVAKLQADKRLATLWLASAKENNYFNTLEGVRCRITADILNKRFSHVEDIKTTSCKSQREFELAAHKYGYFRQGAFYMAVGKVKTATFSGIQKSMTPQVYTVPVEDFPLWLKEGKEEYLYLLNVHKRYAK